MKAGDHNDAVLFYKKEQAVGETLPARPPPSIACYREQQGRIPKGFNCRVDGLRETNPQRRAILAYRLTASWSSAAASGSQTTGSLTV